MAAKNIGAAVCQSTRTAFFYALVKFHPHLEEARILQIEELQRKYEVEPIHVGALFDNSPSRAYYAVLGTPKLGAIVALYYELQSSILLI